MSQIPSAFVALTRSRSLRFVLATLMLLSIVGGVTRATVPTIPTVSLASEPLYARGFRSKPSLTLALSVEFPTVGAAYVSGVASSTDDATYTVATTYVGYYDSEGCYTYDKTNRYFTRSGAATSHACGGSGFSGNFMNWATSSAIDILRFALTGGDRVESLDTGSLTVLQRAVLRTGFYNSSNFPSKQITAAQAAGAVPSALLNGYNGTVYVANCLTQIYFGTAKTGSCGAAGDNGKLLPVFSITPKTGSLVTTTGTYSVTACAGENGICTFPSAGTYNVAYGSGTSFYVRSVTGVSVSCSNAFFGDPIVGTAKSCFLPASGSSLSQDPYFLARVKVCDPDDAAARKDLCQQYPNGNYKPVGNLQKYSDRIRVAVFGYLMDDAQSRNGGVLRAPMKYVGPKYYDDSFNLVASANPLQEWSTDTGVFTVNPNSDTMGVSGAINYTNHFGRTGATPGTYKTYDPISELYYEALRYLQGLQPTASAVSSISDAMKDGFPVYTSWTDPNPLVSNLADYSCVKNNILTIGDVNTHGDRYIPGNTIVNTTFGDTARAANPAGNEPDFWEWTNVVGSFERNDGRGYLDGKARSQTATNPMTTNAFFSGLLGDRTISDYAGYYMAGMAYWANTHDIRAAGLSSYSPGEVSGSPNTYVKSRPGMRVTSYFIDVNEYGAGSTLSNRKSNQLFLSAKYGGFSDDSTTGSPFKDALNLSSDSPWMSSTSPGDPKTYFLGSNGQGMIDALNNVFASVAKQAGSIAGAAISGDRVVTSGGVFQAKFDPTNWSGDVVNYPISVDSAGNVTIGDDSNPIWRASTTAATTGSLDSMTAAERNIYIGFTTPTAAKGTATQFLWDATNFEASTKQALRTPPYSSTSTLDPEDTGKARLAYLRGDASNEGQGLLFRARNGRKLGDIVNSAVVYSGAPSASITETSYATFYNANKSRASTVFVGANDGMLHAFDAATGRERFAYVPSFAISKLAALTSPSYVHTSYVDATPAVAEARIGGESSTTWKTVLVSGAGAGAQGLFALDVTAPASFNANSVLWEFSDADDADLGNVIGRPRILKFKKGTDTRYFAVVASGVNNYANDGRVSDETKSNGAPVLFFLDLAKAAGEAWALGTNYFKIALPVGDATKANGLVGFTPVDAANGTGTVGVIYAGDLQGNLWKLDMTKADFSSNSPSSWNLAKVSGYTSSGTPVPFYIAKDASTTPKVQPISTEPAVLYGPGVSKIVVFGTGRFLEQGDLTTPYAQQSLYAVYDGGGGTVGSSTSAGRGYLQAATVNSSTKAISASAFKWGLPSSPTDTTLRAGFYLDFPESTTYGERMISGLSTFAFQVLFGTINPPANGCADGGGNQYVVDVSNASGVTVSSPVGLQGQPFVLKIGASAGTDPTASGRSRLTTRYQIFQQGSGGVQKSGAAISVDSVFGRLSWRQLANPADAP